MVRSDYGSYLFDRVLEHIYSEGSKTKGLGSPNNVKRLYISESGCAIDGFVGGRRYVSFPQLESSKAIASPKYKNIVSVLSGASSARVCSNIEEIVYCVPLKRETVIGVKELLTGTVIDSTVLLRGNNGVEFNYGTGNKFKRLRSICYCNRPITEVLSLTDRYPEIKSGSTTVSQCEGMAGAIQSKLDLGNVEWYRHYSLRSAIYSLDTPNGSLGRLFRKVEETLERQFNENKKSEKMDSLLSSALPDLKVASKMCRVALLGYAKLLSCITDNGYLNVLLPDCASTLSSYASRIKTKVGYDKGAVKQYLDMQVVEILSKCRLLEDKSYLSAQGMVAEQTSSLKTITVEAYNLIGEYLSYLNSALSSNDILRQVIFAGRLSGLALVYDTKNISNLNNEALDKFIKSYSHMLSLVFSCILSLGSEEGTAKYRDYRSDKYWVELFNRNANFGGLFK